MQKTWKYIIVLLLLAVFSVWIAFAKSSPTPKIIACDVGQGDAILVINGSDQILVDGGVPNGKVVDCLSRHLPPFDRNIEVVVMTHPQLDHYGGLIEVVKRYNVGLIVATPLDSSSSEYQVLKREVGDRGIAVFNPTSSKDLRLGLMYLDILWPSQAFLAKESKPIKGNSESNVLGATTSSRDPNDFSIVLLLRLREFEALFTGDIGPELSDTIADILQSKQVGKVEYIKVPHHGSRNGMTEKLLQTVMPNIAVISAGQGNRYGHPHKEILEMIEKYGVETKGTYEEGDVVVEF